MYKFSSKKNRVINTDLQVTYSIEPVDYETESGTAQWYRITRKASKSYSFVDLTESGAADTVSERVALYTRPYYKLDRRADGESFPQSIAVTQLTTSIVPSKVGRAWRVDIEVDEKDVRASDTIPDDPAWLFSVENERDYDEGDGTLEIIEAYVTQMGTSTITIETSLKESDLAGAILEFKTSESQTEWSTASFTRTGKVFTSESIHAGDIIRIVSGPHESNVFTVSEGLPGHIEVTWAWGTNVTYDGSVYMFYLDFDQDIKTFNPENLSGYYRASGSQDWRYFTPKWSLEDEYAGHINVVGLSNEMEFKLVYSTDGETIESEPFAYHRN